MTMSASSSAAAAEAELLVHAAFNSTATHFVAATASGIRVFSCTPLKHVFSKGFVPSPDAGSRSRVITADLAPSGTLAAVVFRPDPSAAAPSDADDEGDRIRYCSVGLRGHLLRDDDISINSSTSSSCRVRAVRHEGGHVLVAGDGKTALHGTSSGRALKQCLEVDTGPNPLGVCALAEVRGGKQTVVLASPRPAKGQVQVCHRGSGGGRGVDVHAHRSSIVCVALSRDGRLLATASSKGTVVRIFTVADGNKVNEVRYIYAWHTRQFVSLFVLQRNKSFFVESLIFLGQIF